MSWESDSTKRSMLVSRVGNVFRTVNYGEFRREEHRIYRIIPALVYLALNSSL